VSGRWDSILAWVGRQVSHGYPFHSGALPEAGTDICKGFLWILAATARSQSSFPQWSV
jgi:hypothetical protein